MPKFDDNPEWNALHGSRRIPAINKAWNRSRALANRALNMDLSIKGHRHPGSADEICPGCPNRKKH